MKYILSIILITGLLIGNVFAGNPPPPPPKNAPDLTQQQQVEESISNTQDRGTKQRSDLDELELLQQKLNLLEAEKLEAEHEYYGIDMYTDDEVDEILNSIIEEMYGLENRSKREMLRVVKRAMRRLEEYGIVED